MKLLAETRATKVLLSLGSNIEPRKMYLLKALFHLKRICYIHKVSSIYETEPWGYANQGKFLNIAVSCFPASGYRSPVVFLKAVKRIEKVVGRKNRGKWREREIDIDIVLWGDVVVKRSDIGVPHRFFREREFVLVPSCEIEPEMVDPETGKTLRQLLETLR